ncbi:hypothetical protein D0469_12290 [Peribacillus saganii]|uniref:Uncharacterized protein n=1 Tax=Peribacillus saganii TaxID=2303992 RepID=A0A372LNE8_9BACI|nr:hypothetical protein [Peribacillus saganii]RFU68509.1 hypothetical protein D0469_12290 [Peribacillus saganii]
MDGLFFYWLSWIAVIILLFFTSKSWRFRFPLLIHLFVLMVVARYQINASELSINLSVIYIFIAVFIHIRRLRFMQLAGFVVSVFTASMAYCCFQLYSILDPVWLLFDKSWLLAISLNYLSLLLFSAKSIRVVGLMAGMALGDIMTAILLSKVSMPYSAGSFSWLDDAALSLGLATAGIMLGYASRLLQAQTIQMQKERPGYE